MRSETNHLQQSTTKKSFAFQLEIYLFLLKPSLLRDGIKLICSTQTRSMAPFYHQAAFNSKVPGALHPPPSKLEPQRESWWPFLFSRPPSSSPERWTWGAQCVEQDSECDAMCSSTGGASFLPSLSLPQSFL